MLHDSITNQEKENLFLCMWKRKDLQLNPTLYIIVILCEINNGAFGSCDGYSCFGWSISSSLVV